MAFRIGTRSPLDSKGFKGVRDVADPYSVPSSFLVRARNLYLPDPGSGSGAYARPGFHLANESAPLGDLASGRIGQGMTIATIEDGTDINFIVVGSKMYRVSAGFAVFEDVTPVGVTIDATHRVYLTPFSNRILVNDDVNTPWVASDLDLTPVTATKITYSTVGAAWRAFGPAAIYDGAALWVVRQRDAENRTARIAWSEPDDPLSGYFQSGPPAFDNEWDVIENDGDEIYALLGTNLAVDYFRANSIGYLSGTIGSDFRTTATKDAITAGEGTRAPATIAAFGDWIYFADEKGRVQRVQQSGGVQPLWKQHRRVVTLAPTGFVDSTARMAIATIVPDLDLYLIAIWSQDPTKADPQFPTVLYAWDAATGMYVGEWSIGDGCAVHSIGTLVGADGQLVLAVLGTKTAPATPQPLGVGGYLWYLAGLEDGYWTDNGALPDISATPALAYDADLMLQLDEVVAIVQELETDPTAVAIDLVAD